MAHHQLSALPDPSGKKQPLAPAVLTDLLADKGPELPSVADATLLVSTATAAAQAQSMTGKTKGIFPGPCLQDGTSIF